MTHNQATNMNRLKTVLEAYGASEVAWPASERENLKDLLIQSEDAQVLLKQAQILDQLIDSKSTNLTAPSSLIGAIMEDAESQLRLPVKWSLRAFLRPFLKPASGLFAAACLGVLIGFSSPNLLVSYEDVNFDDLSVSDTVLEWELGNGNT